MTDVEFFRKKAEEAGFDITCEKDKRIIEGLGYASFVYYRKCYNV